MWRPEVWWRCCEERATMVWWNVLGCSAALDGVGVVGITYEVGDLEMM